ncbi:MAG: ABC transporter permease [Terrimesophilobacter sp.]
MNPIPTLVAVVALSALITALLLWRRIPEPWMPAWALVRGATQLALLSLILGGIIGDPGWVAVALLVMFSAAVWTVRQRIGRSTRSTLIVAVSLAAGVVVPLGVVFLAGAVEASGRYLLAFGGIIIGGSMTVATLAGRHFNEALVSRHDEVEAWLSLGATPRQAMHDLATHAIHHALIPSTDQTRTTGLVALPGSFVGAIFGGASVWQAGMFQLVVLTGILAAGVITTTLLTTGMSRSLKTVTGAAPLPGA